jgi:DNA polymerase elongation subunit (family B)
MQRLTTSASMYLFLLHAQYIEKRIHLVCKSTDGTTVCLVVADWFPWVYSVESSAKLSEAYKYQIQSMQTVQRMQFIGFTNEVMQTYRKMRVKWWPVHSTIEPRDDTEPTYTMRLLEDSVQPHTKFFTETGLRSGAWLDYSGNSLKTCAFRQLKPSLDKTDPPCLLHMAWDFETTGLDGRTKTANQVCCVFWTSTQPLLPDARSVVLCSQPTETTATNVVQCAGEKDMLDKFIKLIKKEDPDVLLGYNTCGFDQKFLKHRLHYYGMECSSIARVGRAAFREFEQQIRWVIPGRSTLDLFLYCKTNFPTLPNFKLETAAQEFLGQGKDDVLVSEIFAAFDPTGTPQMRGVIADYW